MKEKPGERYFFIGVRYRGDVLPQFLVNAFASEGTTFYSNIVGVEARHPQRRLLDLPALTYRKLRHGRPRPLPPEGQGSDATGQLVGDQTRAGRHLRRPVDLQWSVKIHSPNIDFEYGGGIGLGVVTGSLIDNWVYANPSEPKRARRWAATNRLPPQCTSTIDGSPAYPGNGCNPAQPHGPQPQQGRQLQGAVGLQQRRATPILFPWLATSPSSAFASSR